MIYTTLNKIRAADVIIIGGWAKLLRHLGKTEADDEPLSLGTILDSNGLFDALWCMHAVDGHEREMRLFAVWCARRVQHLLTDPRSVAVIDVAERHANGRATDEELVAARDAAFAAAECMWAIAADAAKTAAWDTARVAARAAASAAVRAAVAAGTDAEFFVAAKDAAMAAEYAAQEAEFRRMFLFE